jgi:hypothetical protein
VNCLALFQGVDVELAPLALGSAWGAALGTAVHEAHLSSSCSWDPKDLWAGNGDFPP